jgi:hypothetical protein
MQKWEYAKLRAIIKYKRLAGQEKFDATRTVELQLPTKTGVSSKAVKDTNPIIWELGQAGWEMISRNESINWGDSLVTETITYTFKRPIEEE